MMLDDLSLERHLIPPERWDLEVPPEVRVEGISDEIDRYPVGYGRHPDKGWFVLGAGQGPFIIWAEWLTPSGVQELTDFATPSPPRDRAKEALIHTLRRLQAVLQENSR